MSLATAMQPAKINPRLVSPFWKPTKLSRLTYKKIAVLVLSLILPQIVAAQEQDCGPGAIFTPMSLDQSTDQSDAVRSLLPPWDTEQDAVFVRFRAYVMPGGVLKGLCCFSSNYGIHQFDRETLTRRLENLKFNSPTVNGQAKRTYAGLSVVAKRTENGVASVLVFHRMLQMEDFGMDYIAPQRIRTQWGSYLGPSRTSGGYGEITVNVDETGKARDARVTRLERGPEEKFDNAIEKMNRHCFIPGFVDGKAVSMEYSEVITNASFGVL